MSGVQLSDIERAKARMLLAAERLTNAACKLEGAALLQIHSGAGATRNRALAEAKRLSEKGAEYFGEGMAALNRIGATVIAEQVDTVLSDDVRPDQREAFPPRGDNFTTRLKVHEGGKPNGSGPTPPEAA